MARTRTLAQLRADVLWQFDREGTTLRNASAYVDRAINQSIAEFREALSDGGDPYFLQKLSGNLNVGPADSTVHFGTVDLSALNPSHQRVYGFDIQDAANGGVWLSLEPAMFRERNDLQRTLQIGPARPRQFFQYERSTIAYAPASDTGYPYLIWYLPVHVDLVADGDTFDGINGWEDWVVFNAGMRLLLRDRDEHLPVFEGERKRLMDRVLHVGRQRQRAGAQVRGGNFGRDRRGLGRDYPFPWGGAGDSLNQPGTGENGRVAIARGDGKLNYVPGNLDGDKLGWVGNIWVPQREFINLDGRVPLDGSADAAAGLQALANTLSATRPGAHIVAPPGSILRLDSQVNLKQVTFGGLRETGINLGHAVFPGVPSVGVRLNINHTTGYGFFLDEESCIRNVEFWYPSQVAGGSGAADCSGSAAPGTGSAPTVYDYAIYALGQGCTVENVSLGNAYKGIRWEANGGKIDTVHGHPLFWGLYFGRVADPVHVSNAHFNGGNYLEGTGLATWRWKNAIFMSFDGVEQAYVEACFAFGYLQGWHFEDFDADGVGTSLSIVNSGAEVTEVVRQISGLGFLELLGCPGLVPRAAANNFPDGSSGVDGNGIVCADNAAPATFINVPTIQVGECTFFGDHGRTVWVNPNSRTIVKLRDWEVKGTPSSAALYNESTNLGAIDSEGMATGVNVTRTGGTGYIRDRKGVLLRTAAGNGSPRNLSVRLTAQTGNVAGGNLCGGGTGILPAGQYLYAGTIEIYQAGGGSAGTVTLNITSQDAVGSRTQTTTQSATATGFGQSRFQFISDGVHPVTWSITGITTSGSLLYNATIDVEPLG